MKILGLMTALLAWTGLAAQAKEAPETFLKNFLEWYLPAAMSQGSAVVLDARMERAVEAGLLKKWRRSAASASGLDFVPFLGQDFDELWARKFVVKRAHGQESRVVVPVVYDSPTWKLESVFRLKRVGEGWRIEGWEVKSARE